MILVEGYLRVILTNFLVIMMQVGLSDEEEEERENSKKQVSRNKIKKVALRLYH